MIAFTSRVVRHRPVPPHRRAVAVMRFSICLVAALGPAAAVARADPPPAKHTDCNTMNVDDVVMMAESQYAAGFVKAALSLMRKGLVCKQDVGMYRRAAMYACAAQDAASAKQYYRKLPEAFQPPIAQRCQQENIILPAPGVPSPASGSDVCASINTDDLMTQAGYQYAAGFAKSALALAVKALACKQDAAMYRLAASYACAAHDAAAARQYFDKVPPAAQPAIVDHCRRAKIALPAPAAPSTAPPSTCATMNVDDMMAQAGNQFAAGFPKAALLLLQKALECKQDIRMYRAAGLYACAAHDQTAAKHYHAKLPAQFQPPIVQKCQQEGLIVP